MGNSVLGLDLSARSTGAVIIEDTGSFPDRESKWVKGVSFGAENPLKDPLAAYDKIRKEVKSLIVEHDPWLVCVEAPLINNQMSALLSPLYWIVVNLVRDYQKFLVTIDNQQLASMMLKKKKRNKSQVVKHWKTECPWSQQCGRVKADIVEAFYVAFYGLRFVYTADEYRKSGQVPLDMHEKEKHCFISEDLNKRGQPKGMLHRTREFWFDFTPEQERQARWLTSDQSPQT